MLLTPTLLYSLQRLIKWINQAPFRCAHFVPIWLLFGLILPDSIRHREKKKAPDIKESFFNIKGLLTYPEKRIIVLKIR